MNEERCGKCKYCKAIIDNSGKEEKVVGLVCVWTVTEEKEDAVYLCGANDETCDSYEESVGDGRW